MSAMTPPDRIKLYPYQGGWIMSPSDHAPEMCADQPCFEYVRDDGWRDIATAPKDGSKVDLWLVNENGEGWREADAYWVDDYYEDFSSYDSGKHEYKHTRRSGWFAPNHDYDGAAGFCDQPVRNYGRPLRPTWKTPTHWMPFTAPPAA